MVRTNVNGTGSQRQTLKELAVGRVIQQQLACHFDRPSGQRSQEVGGVGIVCVANRMASAIADTKGATVNTGHGHGTERIDHPEDKVFHLIGRLQGLAEFECRRELLQSGWSLLRQSQRLGETPPHDVGTFSLMSCCLF